ncbi:uncharacterized protein LOC115700123 [Cannabis sativa]|uniref:uncharacterized protein LOC115700123 n=1 Tax=Cannabis sativa TaxID=3483 RepID=UPI0029CA4BEE|nr:uncharacterized protein LOC115700123 [Cannabis sativa]
MNFMGVVGNDRVTYYRVEWDVLRAVMHRMGFVGRWIDLVMTCVSTVRHKVVHGGHVLSLSSRLVESAKVTLFQHTFSLYVQKLFEQASGQKVNRSKSSIFFSPNTDALTRSQVCYILHMIEALEGSMYPGLPNIIGRNKNVVLGFIKNKIIARINSWDVEFLSCAGKEILLKTVIQSLPPYAMSVFLLPLCTCTEIEKLMATFGGRLAQVKDVVLFGCLGID